MANAELDRCYLIIWVFTNKLQSGQALFSEACTSATTSRIHLSGEQVHSHRTKRYIHILKPENVYAHQIYAGLEGKNICAQIVKLADKRKTKPGSQHFTIQFPEHERSASPYVI